MKGIIFVLALGLLGGPARPASAGGKGSGCCPRCSNKTCIPVAVNKEVKKHCYEVECKEICIPKTRFPWQKNCKPTCGRVINVRVFKKVDLKCQTCGYKWQIQGGDCGGKGGKLSGERTPTPAIAVRPPQRLLSFQPPRPQPRPTVRRASFFDFFKK